MRPWPETRSVKCHCMSSALLMSHVSVQNAPEKVADVMTKKHVFTCQADTSIDEGTFLQLASQKYIPFVHISCSTMEHVVAKLTAFCKLNIMLPNIRRFQAKGCTVTCSFGAASGT